MMKSMLHRLRGDGLRPKLMEVNIQTVNSCTRKCEYCYYGNRRTKAPVRFMDVELFQKILDDLSEAGFNGIISPFEGNEPLLDNRLPLLVKRISDTLHEAKSLIYTNGDLITSERTRELLDAGLSVVYVSLHDKKNEEKANELAGVFGEKRIVVQKMYEMKPSDLHNFAGVVENDLVSQVLASRRNCVLPFRQLVIDTEGNVNLCCVDIADRISFGNARDRSVVDIFYKSTKLNLYRLMLNHKRRCFLRICKNCSFPGITDILRIDAA
jgi:MoaA/NifB/PqqE/SkfB family radical SAM enzyme